LLESKRKANNFKIRGGPRGYSDVITKGSRGMGKREREVLPEFLLGGGHGGYWGLRGKKQKKTQKKVYAEHKQKEKKRINP